MLSSPSISKVSLVYNHPSPKQFCIGIPGFLTTRHVICGRVLFSVPTDLYMTLSTSPSCVGSE